MAGGGKSADDRWQRLCHLMIEPFHPFKDTLRRLAFTINSSSIIPWTDVVEANVETIKPDLPSKKLGLETEQRRMIL